MVFQAGELAYGNILYRYRDFNIDKRFSLGEEEEILRYSLQKFCSETDDDLQMDIKVRENCLAITFGKEKSDCSSLSLGLQLEYSVNYSAEELYYIALIMKCAKNIVRPIFRPFRPAAPTN